MTPNPQQQPTQLSKTQRTRQASKEHEKLSGVCKPLRIRDLTYEFLQMKAQLHQLRNPCPPQYSTTQDLVQRANPLQLKGIFRRYRVLANVRCVNHFAHHGCSKCTTTGEECEKCACGRTQCDLCKGECINCGLKFKTSGMSQPAAIDYVTETVRTLLLQAYVLKGGTILTAHPILKSRYADIIVKVHFCFENLKPLGVAL